MPEAASADKGWGVGVGVGVRPSITSSQWLFLLSADNFNTVLLLQFFLFSFCMSPIAVAYCHCFLCFLGCFFFIISSYFCASRTTIVLVDIQYVCNAFFKDN